METALKLLFIIFLTLGLSHTRRMKRGGTHHCWYPDELESRARGLQRLLGRASTNHFPLVTLVEELEQQKHNWEKGCPDLRQYSSHRSDFSHRSISPWEYRIDYDENRYPPKLAFAHCLCEGCIDAETGDETLSLNSVPLEHTMLVLQRQSCPGHPGQYSFDLKYIKVPVGCTCVLPKNSG